MRCLAMLLVVTIVAGCSSMYTPRTTQRVNLTMKGGEVVYLRDGETIKNGSFGAGLKKAVRGNPLAEAAAQKFHDKQVTGTIVLGVAMVAFVALGVRMGYHESHNEDPDVIDGGLILAGVVTWCIGFQQIFSAVPYLYDALNIYNDSVEGFVPKPPGGGVWVPPPAPAATPTGP